LGTSAPDVFISYAHEDRDWVRPLAAELERGGRSVFWDRRIPAGQTWRSHIGRALKHSRCVVVVWSADSVESDWVLEEADHGKRRGVLVPVRKHPVDPPLGFGQLQAADLSGWRPGEASHEFETFLADLAAVLGPAPPAVAATTESVAVERGAEAAREKTDGLARGEPSLSSPAGAGEAFAAPAAAPESAAEDAPASTSTSSPSRTPGAGNDDAGPTGAPLPTANVDRPTGSVRASRSAAGLLLFMAAVVIAAGFYVYGYVIEEASPPAAESEPVRTPPADLEPPAVTGPKLPSMPTVTPPTLTAPKLPPAPAPTPPMSAALPDVQLKPPTAESSPPAQTETTPAISQVAGQTFTDTLADGSPCPFCPEMVVIPAGSFAMGSPAGEIGRDDDEGPQRTVTFSQPFAIGRYEVTFAEWDACVAAGGCNAYRPDDEGWGRDQRPVINVSWQDAQTYTAWLTARTGKPYRLPTEAEWEYAARAGRTTPFWTGATISTAQANYDGNYTYNDGEKGVYRARTVTVDDPTFPANPFGLYHVHGNVWEWVQDCAVNADVSVQAIILGIEGCPSYGQRGGSWNVKPEILRSASRSENAPDFRIFIVGFRVARALTP
jgi:formylglycine-generating enzyme required for sulfatase activity